jgi:Rod binding domain-containing protein
MGSSIISGVLSNPSTNFGPGSKDSPQKIHAAAVDFESLMIGQIMKSMHEEDGEGWLGTGEDQTASSAMGMADEYFAKAMASKGGLGLAKMISAGMEKRTQSATNEHE